MKSSEINLKSLYFSLSLGAINGFLFTLAFQPVNTAYMAYDWRRMISQFNGSPPSTYYPFTPLAEFLFFVIVFTVASYTVHRFWSAKIKSEVILWQIVAIVAIVVPSVIFYIAGLISSWASTIQWRLDRGEWGYLPNILPHKDSIEFAVLLLCLAVSVNFLYGAVIGKLSKRFTEQ